MRWLCTRSTMRYELRCVRELPEERVQSHEPVEAPEVKHVEFATGAPFPSEASFASGAPFPQKRHLRQERQMNLPSVSTDGGVRCAICIFRIRVGTCACPSSSGCASQRRMRQMRHKVRKVFIQGRCRGGPVHLRQVQLDLLPPARAVAPSAALC